MSAILTAKGLAAGLADRLLFSGLDLVITPGEITGLVGANGAGKSTLLRILAGLVQPDQGDVGLSPPAATVGYLSQEPERRPGESINGFIARRAGVARAQQDLDEATALLVEEKPGADDAYAAALERWLALGGADLEERAAAVFTTLGLPADAGSEAMTRLSGGQAARVNLASLLLSRYDVFLLDEPTNDLDIAGLEILEGFVRGLRAGTVLVSHDRAFLERTVHRVLELDLAQQQVRLYGGGYLAYLEERQIAREHAREAYEKYAGTRAGLQERMRTQIGWADKGVRQARAKATDNDKHILHRQVARSEKLAGKVKATERMLDRLDVVAEPRKEWQLKMEIAAAPRSGTVAATLRDAVIERGGFRLGPVSLQVNWADRIAITGPNGPASRPSSERYSAGYRWYRVTRPWAAASRSARWIRPAACSTAGSRCWRRSRRRSRPCSQRTSGRCWPSTDWWPATCCARRARCRRASGPGRPWRCSRPGA